MFFLPELLSFVFVPDIYSVNVHTPENPESYAWKGAARFSRNCKMNHALHMDSFVTRAQYLEHGSSYVNEKFATSW